MKILLLFPLMTFAAYAKGAQPQDGSRWEVWGEPDELTESLSCVVASTSSTETAPPVPDEYPTSYQLAKTPNSWVLRLYETNSRGKLPQELVNPVATRISINGREAMEAVLRFKRTTDYWGSTLLSTTLPESVRETLSRGEAIKLKMQLPAEANETYGGPYVPFPAVYGWQFDHWTYRAGVAFCEKATAEDDGWF